MIRLKGDRIGPGELTETHERVKACRKESAKEQVVVPFGGECAQGVVKVGEVEGWFARWLLTCAAQAPCKGALDDGVCTVESYLGELILQVVTDACEVNGDGVGANVGGHVNDEEG